MPAGQLIVISAPSGAGKTTLCARLLADFPKLVLSISSTTRPPRGSEKNGVEYHFLSQTDFERLIQADRFAEWARVHGNYYGTSKDTIEQAFDAGNSVLLDIDVQGAASLARAYPLEAFRIFVAPPSMAVLEERLRGRGTDSEDMIRKRLENARQELARSGEFDKVVVNDHFERAYQELSALVRERLKH